jgi:hypothetical protein
MCGTYHSLQYTNINFLSFKGISQGLAWMELLLENHKCNSTSLQFTSPIIVTKLFNEFAIC